MNKILFWLFMTIILFGSLSIHSFIIQYAIENNCEKELQELREYYHQEMLGVKAALPGDTIIIIVK